MYSYSSQRTFPWVLEILNIEPFNFYKIIEMIVRAEDQLPRDVLKHLNSVSCKQVLRERSTVAGCDLPVAD